MTSEIISPEAIQIVKQEESIKIEHNSKGYTWSYRLIGKPEELMTRVDTIEILLKSKFNKEEK